MADQELEILRGYELRLLRCTVVPPLSDAPLQPQPSDNQLLSSLPLHSCTNNLLHSIKYGDYLRALSSDAARIILGSLHFELIHTAECADGVFLELLRRVKAFIADDSENDTEKACRVVLVMCLAIAALFWFTQCNKTGPSAEHLLKNRFPLRTSDSEGSELEWENWARNQLTSAGSDLLGKFSYLHVPISNLQ